MFCDKLVVLLPYHQTTEQLLIQGKFASSCNTCDITSLNKRRSAQSQLQYQFGESWRRGRNKGSQPMEIHTVTSHRGG